MSGIAGVVTRTDAPVDREILLTFADFLAFCGPDGSSRWQHRNAGLVHARLELSDHRPGGRAAGDEHQTDRQPCSLDGHVWITADARIDAQPELIAALRSCGRVVSESLSDAALILHAYHAWGIDCPRHMLGDFAFAIVDPDNRRVFCARDQLGVKPFYYSCSEELLVFSNSLDCVRLHPSVSPELDDQAVADFLLFGLKLDTSATTFADVRRLPAGHTLVLTPDGLQIRSYWSPPMPDELRYVHPQDYIDRFRDIFASAISDRVRANQVGIFLSGGLDSSSVAIMALDHMQRRTDRGRVRVGTFVYDRLIPDGERPFAAQVSTAMGVPHDFFVVDDFKLFDESWDTEAGQTPEPEVRGFRSAYREAHRSLLAHARVFLTGDGADEGLRPPTDYFLCLLREGRLGRWGADIIRHLVAHRELPAHRVRATIRQALGRAPSARVFPDWLNPHLVRRLDLESRWQDHWKAFRTRGSQVPGYLATLTKGVMAHHFERVDPGNSGIPLQRYSPLFDLRMVEFLFSLPTVPWKFDKYLFRRAMKGRLPELILNRPKTPLAGDPLLAYFRKYGFRFPVEWKDCLARTPELELYRTEPVGDSCERTDFGSASVLSDVRCFELASWLYHRKPRPASRTGRAVGAVT